MKLFTTLLTTLFTLLAFASSAFARLTYEGVVADTAGNPLTGTVTVKFEIKDPTNACLLFRETKTLNLVAADQGYFSALLSDTNSGTPRESGDPGFTFDTIFQNSTALTSLTGCTTGTSYTPASSNDERKLYLTVTQGATTNTLGPLYITPIARASVAQTLEGKGASSFLAVNAGSNLTQSNLESVFNGGNFSALSSLIAGSSSLYMKPNANSTVTLPTSASPSSPVAGAIWYDAGSIKYYNGSSTQTLGVGGGGVTSVATGSGLAGGPITTSGTISLANSGVTSGTYRGLTIDAFGRVTSAVSTALAVTEGGTGSTSFTADRVIVSNGTGTALQPLSCTQGQLISHNASGVPVCSSNFVIPVSAGTNGQMLQTDGAGNLSWVTPAPTQINVGNGTVATPSLSFSSDTSTGIYRPTASTLSVAAGGVEAARFNYAVSAVNYLNVTPGGTGSGVQVGAAGSDANVNINLVPKGTGNVLLASGNLGIGVSNPADKLEVNGNIIVSNQVTAGQIKSGDGTQTAPGHTFSDTTTGMFWATGPSLAFTTNGAEKMRLDTTGRLGVGTISPATQLHVQANGSATSISSLVYNTATTANSSSDYTLKIDGSVTTKIGINASPTTGTYSFGNTSYFEASGSGGIALNATNGGANANLRFFANGEKARIMNTATGPTLILFPSGIAATQTGSIALRELAANGTNAFALKAPDSLATDVMLTLPNSAGTANDVLKTDGAGNLSWGPALPSPIQLPSGGTAATPAYSFQSSTTTGIFSPAANELAFSTAGTDRLHILSSGNVGIGITSPSYTLHVQGTAGLSTGTAWTNASDLRLKDIHGDYEYGLAEVLQLHTVRYNYKKDNPLKLPSDFQKTGFIAQEVQKVIPDAVSKREDGYLELNVDPIHWAVVNSIQDLYFKYVKRLIASDQKQDEELSRLKSENEALRKRLEALEQRLGQ